MLCFIHVQAIFSISKINLSETFQICKLLLIRYSFMVKKWNAGADPGFEKGGFYLVPKSDTGGATNTYL